MRESAWIELIIYLIICFYLLYASIMVMILMWCFLVELWKGFWWEGRQWGWAVCLYAWLLCGDGFLQRSGLEGHDGSWYDYNTNWFLQVCWVAHFPFPYYVCLLLLFQGIVGKIQYLISFWNIRFLPVHVLLFTKFSLKVLFLNGKRICISQVMLWNTGWRLQLFWLCSLYCWWWWWYSWKLGWWWW